MEYIKNMIDFHEWMTEEEAEESRPDFEESEPF